MDSSAFSDRAIRLVAELRIEEAVDAGEFENLPGMGKPFEFDDTQYDPYWWIRRKTERERMKNLFQPAAKIDPLSDRPKSP